MHYLLEAIIVGLIVILVGFPLSYAIMYANDPNFEFDFKIQFIGNLFLIGFIVHLLCEWVGLNKRYCKNGYACKN